MTGSNRRHSRCKRDALPTELIALIRQMTGKRRCYLRQCAQGSRRFTRFRFAIDRLSGGCRVQCGLKVGLALVKPARYGRAARF